MFYPIRNLIYVQIKKTTEVTSQSGIILNTVKHKVHDRETEGIAVRVGPQAKIPEGSKVFFDVTSGIDYSDEDYEEVIDGVKYKYTHVILREESILGYTKD